MTELRINGFDQIRNILKDLMPFIKFKKDQADALYKAADLLRKRDSVGDKELLLLIGHILTIQENNYVAKRKKTKKELMLVLGLTP